MAMTPSGVATSKRTSRFTFGARRTNPAPRATAATSAAAATPQARLLAALAARGDRRWQARLRAAFRDPLELQLDVVRRLEAVIRVLGEAGLDDAVQGRRHHRSDLGDRGRIVPEDRADQARLALALERLLPVAIS